MGKEGGMVKLEGKKEGWMEIHRTSLETT